MEKYALMITEKPDAAQRIAEALDKKGKPKKAHEKGVPYYVATRNKTIVIVPARGHLYTVMQETGRRSHYPVFDFKWAPRHMAERNARHIRTWIEAIAKLTENADEFIDACDYDIEGSLIGYNVLKYVCGDREKAAKRMKYSTLTRNELEKAYDNLLPKLDFALIEAGRTRHEVDWLYGINLSRALTLSASRWSGKYATLSTGRVQGPALRFLVARERSIRSFVPTPYWSIRAKIEAKDSTYEAEYEKKVIEKKADADAIVEECEDKTGVIEKVDVKQFQQAPPPPFDLGALQAEAYSFFGYMPRRTSDIAERLYLQALISYPRTGSQKLPPAIGYETILRSLSHHVFYKKLAQELLEKGKLTPREGRKEDPAHPAIYPTGNLPEKPLKTPEQRIWDLVIRRFMAVFGEPAVKQNMHVSITVDRHRFHMHGRRVLRRGWLRFYSVYLRAAETFLPELKEGEIVRFRQLIRDDKLVKPPPRYNPGSLLRKMEETGIGTKATRADTIQTLYDRKYIAEERIVSTDLGYDVIEALQKYAPNIISVELTKELEKKMGQIQSGSMKRENVLQEAIKQLKPVLENFKNEEKAVGEALSNAARQAKLQERVVGNCLNCGAGKLVILFSRKTGKRFIGCTGFFKGNCKTSFPIPQRGSIKPLRKPCRSCGWPTIRVEIKGRRPWNMCFNLNCPLKEERRKHLEMQNLQQTITG